ncbi:trypsin, alkaline C-like [Plutella xylostella]|uniref:trypsin, alkaline C-like n=1 Tax=Plutella xylostella TaxID=51655 RepID=UPI0020326F66|nr:trypsin, alkaline C-like [Plutella xylostella]
MNQVLNAEAVMTGEFASSDAPYRLFHLLSAAVAATAQPEHNRIVGETTTVKQYPSVVQVDFLLPNIGWDQMCAGTIITPIVVVSAASCFLGNVTAESRRIRAGSSIRNSGGTIISLRSYRNHPQFRKKKYYKDNGADISLLYLAQELMFTDSVQPVPISREVFLPHGSSVTLATWGRSVPDQDFSPVLRELTLTTMNLGDCMLHSKDVRPEMICVGIMEGGSIHGCRGFTGGPMYHDGLLVGVVSFTRTCAYAYSGVATQVFAYDHWISKNQNNIDDTDTEGNNK